MRIRYEPYATACTSPTLSKSPRSPFSNTVDIQLENAYANLQRHWLGYCAALFLLTATTTTFAMSLAANRNETETETVRDNNQINIQTKCPSEQWHNTLSFLSYAKPSIVLNRVLRPDLDQKDRYKKSAESWSNVNNINQWTNCCLPSNFSLHCFCMPICRITHCY